MQGETALVTGASSGIGYELAKLLAADGNNLVVVARREGLLQKLKAELEGQYPIQVKILVKDLAVDGAPEEIYRQLQAEGIEIHTLINNAGFGDYGDFAATDWEKQSRMIHLNILALAHLSRLFLGEMLAKGRGSLLNVASTASFQPGPKMSVYYASKAFVLSFTEALAREVKGTGIRISVLCPGPTRTGFTEVAYLDNSKLFKNLKVAGAAEVAAYGYRSLKRGKVVAVHGGLNQLMVFLVRFAPRRLVRELVYQLQSPIKFP